MLTMEERILVATFNKIRFSEGAALDENMRNFFGITRLLGETDEDFLNRADEIIFSELDRKNSSPCKI